MISHSGLRLFYDYKTLILKLNNSHFFCSGNINDQIKSPVKVESTRLIFDSKEQFVALIVQAQLQRPTHPQNAQQQGTS